VPAGDRRGESARLNAKSQAKGFSSRGQEYRAKKAGWKGDGKAWNNRLDANRVGFAKSKGGQLAGYKSTPAGVVISARNDPAGLAALEKELKRSWGSDRRVQITFTPDHGQARTYGRFGGSKLSEVKGKLSPGSRPEPDEDDEDDEDQDYDEDDYYGLDDYIADLDSDFYGGSGGGGGTITVTIR
jgi:hypothetical protein